MDISILISSFVVHLFVLEIPINDPEAEDRHYNIHPKSGIML